jgi:hypothetical protein
MSVHDRRASRNQSSDSGWANGEIEKEPLRTAAAKLLKPSKKKKTTIPKPKWVACLPSPSHCSNGFAQEILFTFRDVIRQAVPSDSEV